jgi:hypothetical protein
VGSSIAGMPVPRQQLVRIDQGLREAVVFGVVQRRGHVLGGTGRHLVDGRRGRNPSRGVDAALEDASPSSPPQAAASNPRPTMPASTRSLITRPHDSVRLGTRWPRTAFPAPRRSLYRFDLLLGSGKRVFADGTVPTALQLTESVTYPNGTLQLASEPPACPHTATSPSKNRTHNASPEMTSERGRRGSCPKESDRARNNPIGPGTRRAIDRCLQAANSRAGASASGPLRMATLGRSPTTSTHSG